MIASVQSQQYRQRLQKLSSMWIKRKQVRNKMSSVHLFPCGCTTRLLHFADANVIPSVQHAKVQSPILRVASSMVMPFNIDILIKNGLTDVNHLSDEIQINPNKFITTYRLFGVTHGNGSHFRSAMHLPPIVATQPGWYEYDGL